MVFNFTLKILSTLSYEYLFNLTISADILKLTETGHN
jgi:hypothetical protein